MARGRQSPLVLELSPKERELLPRWQRSTPMAAGLVRRGGMILLLADQHAQGQGAQMGGVQRVVVRQWARRFLAQRLEGPAVRSGRAAHAATGSGGRTGCGSLQRAL